MQRRGIQTLLILALALNQFPVVFALRVPAACLRDAPQDLVLTTSHLGVPKEADPGSQDPRTLGFALDWLALDPAPPGTRGVGDGSLRAAPR